MKDYLIIFNTAMVRAILDGRKTQTRRIIKPSAYQQRYCQEKFNCDADNGMAGMAASANLHQGVNTGPYTGGRKLWVREMWRQASINHNSPGAKFLTIQFKTGYGVLPYRKDWEEFYGLNVSTERSWELSQTGIAFGRWRPSIHMPRWASRITLEVVNTRVERVQDISEEDAIAEGVECACGPLTKCGHCAVFEFQKFWGKINGKRSWELNPWVWIVEFKVAEVER